jgi:hypothetical protein
MKTVYTVYQASNGRTELQLTLRGIKAQAERDLLWSATVFLAVMIFLAFQ